MRHPNDGVLRRLLDEPAAVTDADRDHVRGCPQCLDGLARPRAAGPVAEPAAARPRRAREVLRRPVVAVLAVAALLAGGATAAANDWLPIFRTEQVAPVAFGAADLLALPDLRSYGDVELTGDGDLEQVPDAATAEARTGLDVPEVAALPRGVTGQPVHQVGGEVALTFRFSADRAAQAAAAAGTTLPPPPPGLDGSQLRLVAGPGTAQVWSGGTGAPSLVVGRAVAPSAFSTGVPFDVARDYLLALPGVPQDVAAQLRTFTADGSTLPLPVPSDEVTTSSVEVDGVPATVIALRDQTVAAVVWVDAGVVTAVAGSVDVDELLSVARDLR